MSILSAGTSNTTSLVYTGDTTGAMVFQTNGTTEAMRITAAQNVGIGTNNPVSKLDVFADTATFGDTGSFGFNINGTNIIFRNGIGSSTERMRIDSSGRVTTPFQPGFKARSSTGDITINCVNDGLALISPSFNVTDERGFNTGSHYNTSNGRFTAPVTGIYYFFANVRFETSAFSMGTYLRTFIGVNGNNQIDGYRIGLAVIYGNNKAWDSYMTASVSGLISLTANDYVELKGGPSAGSGTFRIYGAESAWGCYLVG